MLLCHNRLFLSSCHLSTDGSVVEFSPATREARVRFPVSALFFFWQPHTTYILSPFFFLLSKQYSLSFELLSYREDVVTALNNAIDRREEGIIVKLPSSTYRPDKRKGEVGSMSRLCSTAVYTKNRPTC